jgi:general stress protein CsbA
MKVYKSKVDKALLFPIMIVILVLCFTMVYAGSWLGLVIVLMVALLVADIFLRTRYKIEEIKLKVNCSFLVNTLVDINSISRIQRSTSFLSSPATSFDRIEIIYNKFESLIISPADKRSFIEALKQINPRIEINID